MDKPLIIKCNRMFSIEELENFRQIWNSQIAANEVVVLPYGFELAEVNVELLEHIKAEIKQSQNLYYYNKKTDTYEDIIKTDTVMKVIDNYIEELKGEQKREAGTPREDYEPLYNCENWIP